MGVTVSSDSSSSGIWRVFPWFHDSGSSDRSALNFSIGAATRRPIRGACLQVAVPMFTTFTTFTDAKGPMERAEFRGGVVQNLVKVTQFDALFRWKTLSRTIEAHRALRQAKLYVPNSSASD